MAAGAVANMPYPKQTRPICMFSASLTSASRPCTPRMPKNRQGTPRNKKMRAETSIRTVRIIHPTESAILSGLTSSSLTGCVRANGPGLTYGAGGSLQQHINSPEYGSRQQLLVQFLERSSMARC